MRMLSGVEAPDTGTRTEGHQVVMQYFAQDEATRLDPTLTVYQTLAGDAPIHMVPHIRNILGGFLFSGDDVDKPVRVLSGGERTRLAVARMLLRPSNTLLLDEPTNHLDLDSKDVLLDALEDFGGTLIFVSHDRYFVDKLATKVIEIGDGEARRLPGQLRGVPVEQEAARSRGEQPAPGRQAVKAPARGQSAARRQTPAANLPSAETATAASYEDRKKREADARRARKAERRPAQARRRPRSPDRRARNRPSRRSKRRCQPRLLRQPRRRQAGHRPPPGSMWEVGDLMNQWEALQTEL